MTPLSTALTRAREALPEYEISGSWASVVRRAHTWTWPAVQMGVAASLAWVLAGTIAADAAGYAPITAIAALGLGRERRLSRSAVMVGGLLVGVVGAEIVTPIIGTGWWQIGILMSISAIVAGSVIGHELAVTYATINAVVLLTTPGSDGWVPNRLIAGLTGVVAALGVMLLIAPARPVHLIEHRLGRAVDRATTALRTTAARLRADQELERDTGNDDSTGDGRRLIVLARRLDDEIDQSHRTIDQAHELVRWSPWRHNRAADVERLTEVAHGLQPTLRTASTIARLGDRATLIDVTANDRLVDGICNAADVVGRIAGSLIDDEPLDDGDHGSAVDAIGRVMSGAPDHAVLIALQEEVRGLLSDIADIAAERGDRTADDLSASAAGTTIDGIAYGRR